MFQKNLIKGSVLYNEKIKGIMTAVGLGFKSGTLAIKMSARVQRFLCFFKKMKGVHKFIGVKSSSKKFL